MITNPVHKIQAKPEPTREKGRLMDPACHNCQILQLQLEKAQLELQNARLQNQLALQTPQPNRPKDAAQSCQPSFLRHLKTLLKEEVDPHLCFKLQPQALIAYLGQCGTQMGLPPNEAINIFRIKLKNKYVSFLDILLTV